jgi:hypothetical protein
MLQASGSTNGAQDADGGFSLNEVNLDLASQLTNDISAFVSIDFNTPPSAGGVIDYGYIDFANPGPFDLNVRVGRIPSVIGIEQRVSESNQNKFINLSLLSPVTVGSQDGIAVYGSFNPVNYAFAVSNADNRGLATTGAIPVRPGNNNGAAFLAAGAQQNNNDFAVSGRLGVVPIEGLEVGVSGSRDGSWQNAGNPTTPVNVTRTTLGADASYVWGALTLKGEYIVISEQQVNTAADIDWKGYYAEGVYDLNSKISLGVRYSAMNIDQNVGVGQTVISRYSTLSIAGNYRIADNVVVKAEYDINQEKNLQRSPVPSANQPNKVPNNVLALSLVGSF